MNPLTTFLQRLADAAPQLLAAFAPWISLLAADIFKLNQTHLLLYCLLASLIASAATVWSYAQGRNDGRA